MCVEFNELAVAGYQKIGIEYLKLNLVQHVTVCGGLVKVVCVVLKVETNPSRIYGQCV